MSSPLCICNGVIRSGSTWSFNVCRELFQQLSGRTNQPSRSGYMEGAQLEHFITRDWHGSSSSVVIKAHDIGPASMAALRAGTARAVCTFRDPRDCVASDISFMKYPFEVCVKRIGSTLEPLRMYLTTPHILLVRYEDMMADRRREIRRVADHLGVELNESTVHLIDSRTNIETSRRLCASLKDRPVKEVLRLANHIIDPVTHLHHNHINGGTVGRWKHELSNDQIAYMSEFFAPWLLKLGYETSKSLNELIKRNSQQAYDASPMTLIPLGIETFSFGMGEANPAGKP